MRRFNPLLSRVAAAGSVFALCSAISLFFCLMAAPGAVAAGLPFVQMGTAPSSMPDAPPPVPQEGPRSWPATIGQNFGSPAFHDLNGDGVMEIIAADRQRTYVYDAQGALLPGWPQNTGEVNHCPAVADIDEDGTPEILVTTSGAPAKIRCLHPDGSSQPGFPVSLPYQNWLNSAGPAVADVDGDGHLDVGAQSETGVAFFDRMGNPLPGWPYLWVTQQNIPWSAPAVGDLDADGKNEVVVGTNCLYSTAVHVIRADGSVMQGFWPQPTRNIFSSPAIGDLDGDGDLEIVVQEGDPTWYGGRMHVWHHDGSYLPGWPRFISDDWEGSRSCPAIADVDGNGTLEIVTATGDAKLHIFRIDGTELPGYPKSLPGGAISSVQVIDVNADGIEELFLCYWANGNQWVNGWNLAGQALAGFPKVLFTASDVDAHGSAYIADLEGDGDLDLCAQGSSMNSGRVWVYEITGSVYQPGITRADWPKIHRDPRNTGCYPRLDPAGAGDLGPAGALTCFPNPVGAGGEIRMRLPGGPGMIRVYDLAGRRLGERSVQGGRAISLRVGDLFGSDPGRGAYFVRWAGSGGDARTRLVVTGGER